MKMTMTQIDNRTLQNMLRREQEYLARIPESNDTLRKIVCDHIKAIATELLYRWKEMAI